MKIKISILLIVLTIGELSLSQDKRNIFSLSGSGSVSTGILTSVFLGGEGQIGQLSDKETFIERRSYKYNGKINFTYTRLTSKRFGLGVRLFYKRLRVPVDTYRSFSYNPDYIDYDGYSSPELRSVSPAFNSYGAIFMLKFAPKKSILPFGIEYSFGVGPRFYSMVNRPYYGEYTDSTGQTIKGELPQINNLELENQRYRGVEVYFGTELNYAVAKDRFILVGFDLNGSYISRSSYSSLDEPNYNPEVPEEVVEEQFYNTSYANELNNRELTSVWSLHVGYKVLL
tara:strand:- start:78741 stop:79595 length:855 start_codon:yes stop_codon:yes gene_type:complete